MSAETIIDVSGSKMVAELTIDADGRKRAAELTVDADGRKRAAEATIIARLLKGKHIFSRNLHECHFEGAKRLRNLNSTPSLDPPIADSLLQPSDSSFLYAIS